MLISHPLADEPWAEWIANSLRAAGHEVVLDPADATFAQRLTEARHSGTGPILLLLSAEHRAVATDWELLVRSPALVGRLITLRLDACEAPRALRALPCRNLHGLDEEEALEVLLNLAGGVRREKVRTHGLPAVPFSRDGSFADSGQARNAR
ncbi:hypothetical protein Ait01nite_030920 [Actinoplanes italicus]|uniref:TIR domain-containing protein n=1 Tax=Actinoplanes italicus TaxID=113567 RepID=A0A2T0KJ40_9ACTN|nr:toll/interleukin-1 receptor domain-containing protein [Actinoplanes italicus]PRX23550.1 TIR domain-containing protein [Actinoplanes italicus]GIE30047.1 hypothetical protein Ait01nite_030920 [Actinoplanes italicus]